MTRQDILSEEIYRELLERLHLSTALSYINKIYDGKRQTNVENNPPYVTLDWQGDEEEWADMPRRRKLIITFEIKGVLNVATRLDKQVIGDNTQVGALRLKHDIAKAFEDSDIRYSNNISNYVIRTIDSPLIDNSLREVIMELTVETKYFVAEQRE